MFFVIFWVIQTYNTNWYYAWSSTKKSGEELKALTDTAKFKEWDDFCRNEANLYDHTQDPDADASFGTTLTGNIVKAMPPLRAPVQAGDEAEVRRLIEELGEEEKEEGGRKKEEKK